MQSSFGGRRDGRWPHPHGSPTATWERNMTRTDGFNGMWFATLTTLETRWFCSIIIVSTTTTKSLTAGSFACRETSYNSS